MDLIQEKAAQLPKIEFEATRVTALFTKFWEMPDADWQMDAG